MTKTQNTSTASTVSQSQDQKVNNELNNTSTETNNSEVENLSNLSSTGPDTIEIEKNSTSTDQKEGNNDFFNNVLTEFLNIVSQNQNLAESSKKDEFLQEASDLKDNLQNLKSDIDVLSETSTRFKQAQRDLEFEIRDLENKILKEELEWNKVYSIFPQIKENVMLENLVYTYHKELLNRGRNVSLVQAAEEVINSIGSINLSSKSSAIGFLNTKNNVQENYAEDLLSRIKKGDDKALTEFFANL
ncbi:MAG: hypothetical protein NZZ41_04290 [Candidatus Dojkabacteria bacterium]|nr:hypothetical protein [Candidatus Dojkabacteria bacterium]